MRIESIQVGKPKTLASDWTSAIFKQAVEGSILLSKTNLTGDEQADLSVHGGPDKAVNVYPLEHYRYWHQRARFPFRRRIDLPVPNNGAFGENFTVTGMLESNMCLGDTFEIGSAVVQISQPRQPCWKLARKFNQPKLPFWVQDTCKTGWYFRVLKIGQVESMNEFKLIERKNPSWTLERANKLMYAKNKTQEELNSILSCQELSDSWRKTFQACIT